jgi:hypothetical protein
LIAFCLNFGGFYKRRLFFISVTTAPNFSYGPQSVRREKLFVRPNEALVRAARWPEPLVAPASTRSAKLRGFPHVADIRVVQAARALLQAAATSLPAIAHRMRNAALSDRQIS